MEGFLRYLRRFAVPVALLLSCAAGAHGQLVYVPNQFSNSIAEYTINNGGVLGAISGQANSTTGLEPTRLAQTPDAQWLYTANQTGDSISVFHVASNGMLTAVPADTTTVPGGPFGITIATVGGQLYLYTPGYNGNQLYGFLINSSTGALTAVPGSPFSTVVGLASGVNPENVLVVGTYLYVTYSGSAMVGRWSINTANGALTGAGETGAGARPTDLVSVVSGGATYLYVTDNGSSGIAGVWAFPVNLATGALGIPATSNSGGGPSGIAANPAGTFLFVAGGNSDGTPGSEGVTLYSIVNGALVRVTANGAPFTAGNGPVGIAVDPTGRYLYVSNNFGGNVSEFSINTANPSWLTPLGDITTGGVSPYYLLVHNAPAGAAVPAASSWSLVLLGILLAGASGLLFRKAYR